MDDISRARVLCTLYLCIYVVHLFIYLLIFHLLNHLCDFLQKMNHCEHKNDIRQHLDGLKMTNGRTKFNLFGPYLYKTIYQ